MNKPFICPNCQRKLATRYTVHNCMRRIKRSDAGKPRHLTHGPHFGVIGEHIDIGSHVKLSEGGKRQVKQ